MNLIESIQSALYERVVSPLAGVFVGVWCVTHYEAIFILFSDFKVMEKLQFLNEYFVLDAKNKWSHSTWSNYFGVNSAPYYYGLIKPLTTSLVALGVFSFFSVPAYFISSYGKFLLKIIRRRFDEVTPIKASTHAVVVEKYKNQIAMLSEKEFKNEKDLDSYKDLYQKSIEEIEELKSRVASSQVNDQFLGADTSPNIINDEFRRDVTNELKDQTMVSMFFDSAGASLRRDIVNFTGNEVDRDGQTGTSKFRASDILNRIQEELSFENLRLILDILDGMVRNKVLKRIDDNFSLDSVGLKLKQNFVMGKSDAYQFCMDRDRVRSVK